jgi:hypothetical protein
MVESRSDTARSFPLGLYLTDNTSSVIFNVRTCTTVIDLSLDDFIENIDLSILFYWGSTTFTHSFELPEFYVTVGAPGDQGLLVCTDMKRPNRRSMGFHCLDQ